MLGQRTQTKLRGGWCMPTPPPPPLCWKIFGVFVFLVLCHVVSRGSTSTVFLGRTWGLGNGGANHKGQEKGPLNTSGLVRVLWRKSSCCGRAMLCEAAYRLLAVHRVSVLFCATGPVGTHLGVLLLPCISWCLLTRACGAAHELATPTVWGTWFSTPRGVGGR